MKAKRIILCVAVVFLAGILAYSAIQRKHTFTLSNEDGRTDTAAFWDGKGKR